MLLRSFARRIWVRILFLRKECFIESFGEDVHAAYSPKERTIFFDASLPMEDEERALFCLGHELGHAVDDDTDPVGNDRYRLCYALATVYSEMSLPLPDYVRKTFVQKEEMATDIGESILADLGIDIPDGARIRHS